MQVSVGKIAKATHETSMNPTWDVAKFAPAPSPPHPRLNDLFMVREAIEWNGFT